HALTPAKTAAPGDTGSILQMGSFAEISRHRIHVKIDKRLTLTVLRLPGKLRPLFAAPARTSRAHGNHPSCKPPRPCRPPRPRRGGCAGCCACGGIPNGGG